jgi:1,2-diacylglycerol 3-alpha-glucosyltransferase
MNIGFFSETYSPDINGVITSMKNFKEELERAGHKVYIFAPDTAFMGKGRQPESDDTFLFRSFEYPMYKSIRVALPFKRGVMKKIRSLKLDIVHSHTPFSMGYLADKVARDQGIPHVHTYHTLYPEYARHYFPGPKNLVAAAAAKVTAGFCNRTHHVIAPSKGVKEKLVSYGIREPIRVLSTGIERTVFETKDPERSVRKQYGIPLDAPLLVTVARMGYEKSIDFLLRSFKEVLARNPDAYYLVVGDGPAKASLEAQARELGIDHRTIFTGFIHERDAVARAYACADVFVFASKTETQCLTLLEAAAVGMPLVSRYDKPLETALSADENGFFEENEAAFADKVTMILKDRALAARMSAASRRVASKQSAEQRAAELLNLYERVIITMKAQRTLQIRDLSATPAAQPDTLMQHASFW